MSAPAAEEKSSAKVVSSELTDALSAVKTHVEKEHSATFRESGGLLRHPYLVPAGAHYTRQIWDWDSVHEGVGLLPYGGAPYMKGSMLNFLDHTDVATGQVRGCITAETVSSTTIYHAKPVIIQGAWLSCLNAEDIGAFLPYKAKMEALLGYWERERRDPASGCYVWWDQMESGADDLPLTVIPSNHTPEWDPARDGLSISAPDVMVFLHREYVAFANFLRAWAETDPSLKDAIPTQLAIADRIKAALNEYMWSEELGHYVAYDVKTKKRVNNRTFLMAFPLYGGLASPERAARTIEQLQKPDMWTVWGVRSTSSTDERYTNVNIIIPYSNWRGPIWIISNALLAYGLSSYGYKELALTLAGNITRTLAADLASTGSWHECYNSDDGTPLAAPGFLSWNVLAATLLDNLVADKNPFALDVAV